MDNELRDHFDDTFDLVLAALPEHVHKLLQEVPLVVEDHPSDEVMDAFDMEHTDELCGLHDGIPLHERGGDGGEAVPLPEVIYIYREGIYALSLDDEDYVDDAELARQIRITVLHEIGHHFGMTEEQLKRMGYD